MQSEDPPTAQRTPHVGFAVSRATDTPPADPRSAVTPGEVRTVRDKAQLPKEETLVLAEVKPRGDRPFSATYCQVVREGGGDMGSSPEGLVCGRQSGREGEAGLSAGGRSMGTASRGRKTPGWGLDKATPVSAGHGEPRGVGT